MIMSHDKMNEISDIYIQYISVYTIDIQKW